MAMSARTVVMLLGTVALLALVRETAACNRQQGCEVAREAAEELPQIGAYIPQCDSEGNFHIEQCWGSTGYCWCVTEDGVEIQGTRTPPGGDRVNCGNMQRRR